MDLLSAAFVLLIMAIGGVVGFLADRWGRAIGKSRRTLFGLRPRHTATLITVGAGVLIPFVTIVVVAVASSDVRAWLLEGQRAIQRAKDLQCQVSELTDRSKGLDVQIRQKTAQQRDLDARLKATEARLNESKTKAARYQEEARRLAAQASSLASRLRTITAQLAAKKEELATAKTNLAQRQIEFKKLEKTYAELEKQRTEAYDRLNTLDKENEKLSKELAGLQRDIAQLRTDKSSAEQELAYSQKKLTELRESFAKEIQDKTEQLRSTENMLAQVQQQLGQARADLGQSIGISRTNPMIFAYGEELARAPVEPDRSAAEAEAALNSLLRSARVLAEARGARSNGPRPVAGMWEIKTDQQTISVADQERQIVGLLTGKKEWSVLIAYASFNSFKGEWVPLTIRGFLNPIVYHSGETVVEGRIDGSRSDEDVLTQVTAFIQNDVQQKARQDRMIPVHGKEETFGVVPPDEMLAIVKQIRDANRRVRLRAEAGQDTRAADPLRLKFTVR